MKITYQLSLEEYLQAVSLHHSKSHRVLKLIIYITLAAVIVIMGTDFTNQSEIITNILAAFFSISFYMLFVRILSVYQAKNIYTKSLSLKNEITLHISGKGIKFNYKGKDNTLPWNIFTKWKRNEKFYLLYTNPRQFKVIPLRAMNTLEQKEFDAYLQKYIPQS